MANLSDGVYNKVQTGLRFLCDNIAQPSSLNANALALLLRLLPSSQVFLARRCPWTHPLQASTWWINDLHSHPPSHTLPGPANWELPEDRDGTPKPSPKSPMSSSLKFMTYLVFGLGEKEHLGREFFAEYCLEGIRRHFCMLGFASNHHRCHPREPQQHFIPLAVISKDENLTSIHSPIWFYHCSSEPRL